MTKAGQKAEFQLKTIWNRLKSRRYVQLFNYTSKTYELIPVLHPNPCRSTFHLHFLNFNSSILPKLLTAGNYKSSLIVHKQVLSHMKSFPLELLTFYIHSSDKFFDYNSNFTTDQLYPIHSANLVRTDR